MEVPPNLYIFMLSLIPSLTYKMRLNFNHYRVKYKSFPDELHNAVTT